LLSKNDPPIKIELTTSLIDGVVMISHHGRRTKETLLYFAAAGSVRTHESDHVNKLAEDRNAKPHAARRSRRHGERGIRTTSLRGALRIAADKIGRRNRFGFLGTDSGTGRLSGRAVEPYGRGATR